MTEQDFTEEDMKKIVIPFRKVCVAFGKALFYTMDSTALPEGGLHDLWENFADEACAFINSLED